jgi:hypothetical protein
MGVLASISGFPGALILVAVIVWLGGSLLVAFWAQARGYPFWPLFICAAIIGWPVVLLVVVIAAGPDGRQCPACGNGVFTAASYSVEDEKLTIWQGPVAISVEPKVTALDYG